jgi:hypothetical protein
MFKSIHDYRKISKKAAEDPYRYFYNKAETYEYLGWQCAFLSMICCLCCTKPSRNCITIGDVAESWAISLKKVYKNQNNTSKRDYERTMKALLVIENILKAIPETSASYRVIQEDLKDGTWIGVLFRALRDRLYFNEVAPPPNLENLFIYSNTEIYIPPLVARELLFGMVFFLPSTVGNKSFISDLTDFEIKGLRCLTVF